MPTGAWITGADKSSQWRRKSVPSGEGYHVGGAALQAQYSQRLRMLMRPDASFGHGAMSSRYTELS